MFRFFRKKPSSDRDAVVEDFRRATAALKSAEPTVRMAVGIAINTLSTAFAYTFKSAEAFQATPYEQQIEYLKKLRSAEEGIVAKDKAAALGFGPFKMWVGALVAKDQELLTLIKPAIAQLSREGDLLG